jgi:hypothetical protein
LRDDADKLRRAVAEINTKTCETNGCCIGNIDAVAISSNKPFGKISKNHKKQRETGGQVYELEWNFTGGDHFFGDCLDCSVL